MKISKFVLTFSITTLSISSVFAQNDTTQILEPEVYQPTVVYPYENSVIDERDHQFYKIKIEDPAIIEQRLQSIQKSIPLPYNSNVKIWLDFFLMRRPSFTKQMLEDKDIYFPIFEKYLAESGMPDELKYLSMLESGLNPKAVSRSKAVGLWQFMAVTGREKGLSINSYVDERMHIEKSTQAACQYLGELYRRFGDWECALASYNTGPTRIARVRASTGHQSYWDLHPYIHPDTRAYVPQFIAITYLMHFAGEHGIYASNSKSAIPTEKITFSESVDLKAFAEISNINIEDIKTSNPHLKALRLPTPQAGYVYDVAIPSSQIGYFNQNRSFVLDSLSKRMARPALQNAELLTETSIDAGIEDDIVRYRNVVKQVKKSHTVRRGETLGKIANRYDVTVKEVKRWNRMGSSMVRAGQRIIVYTNEKQRIKTVAPKAKKDVQEIAQQEDTQQEVVIETETQKSSKKSKAKKQAPEVEKQKTVVHKVRSGDTLWSIAQRYDGVTVEEIKRLNKIKGNTVKVGQRIKIKS